MESKDKIYPAMFFLPIGGYCVSLSTVQLFFLAISTIFFRLWSITWIFSYFSWGISSHVTCLDQSCMIEIT